MEEYWKLRAHCGPSSPSPALISADCALKADPACCFRPSDGAESYMADMRLKLALE